MYTAEVKVGLKKGVTDPEGSNTKKSLDLLGYSEVKDVKSVKVYRIEIDSDSEENARSRLEEMCERLLTNPVIHTYRIDFI